MTNIKMYLLVLVELLLVTVFILALNINSLFVTKSESFPEPKLVTIHPGMTITMAGKVLTDSGIINDGQEFVRYAKWFRRDKTIKSGLYNFSRRHSNSEAFDLLEKGRGKLIRITFPEGIRIKDFARIIKEKLNKDSTKFDNLAFDKEQINKLRINANDLEGFLLPETYLLDLLFDENKLFNIFLDNAMSIYSENKTTMDSMGLNILEVATMASLVEGECQIDDERPIVASVYYNRLAMGMRLQADPTIQFIIKDGPRRILMKDLEIKSPYNTYINKGLPPGPINNPGRSSILASLYPAKTDFIFFVARGDGGHYFSKTLREHLLNKQKFDRIRRQVAKEKRNKNGR